MDTLNKDDLSHDGFSGLKETRLIKDQKINDTAQNSDGLGSFIYLDDAKFLSHGEVNIRGMNVTDET